MKTEAYFQATYGQPPDNMYYAGDMQAIASYHRYRSEGGFSLDDVTWNDLSMDDVFKRINCAQTTPGEQLLYHMLRRPAMDGDEYGRRSRLIWLAEDDRRRLGMQRILYRLGKSKSANLLDAFQPSGFLPAALILCCLLALGFAALGLASILGYISALPAIISAVLNASFHAVFMAHMQNKVPTANYLVAMVSACLKLDKTADQETRDCLGDMLQAGQRVKKLRSMGGISAVAGNDLAFLANALLLLDIIAYERVKNKLARHQPEIAVIYEHLGMLDAGIAVASFRHSIPHCQPEIDFSADSPAYFRAKGIAHPLLQRPVTNDIESDTPLLITGSNASGKSTFIKAIAVNTILAQAISTAACASYAASSFAVYSSMALSDNLLEGQSYFVVELNTIKRIMDAMKSGGRVMCVVDEILRGTNTVERIAASSASLQHMAAMGGFCIAATHDKELCSLLAEDFGMYHFTERVEGSEVIFDYKLRPGPSTGRNALKLLLAFGFDSGLIAAANARADTFLSTGRWEA